MTGVLIKGLVPSFVISKTSYAIELLLQGDGFSNLQDQKVDIAIESGGGVRWNIDSILSGVIQIEGKPFFVVKAAPVRASFPTGGRAYSDLKITLKADGHIISTQTLKVFYSDPII
ncbi:hypothetical protein J5X98_00125 [Leptothermofonsia sichuanensis E412]|uniref:hypothetical protein n=1 Tax=Leptothermofonsia sichuanensis TaxID=2917832 RepID=UPI001CA6DE23|nr:hypothetical protein [Leptothermofonsia sichuanensis]QZZ20963.1 hypothetical protein J5X98_00125 [Leptothermofonsia sichuanensis E412]